MKLKKQKVEFISTDITFHSRDLRPTQSFERAKERAYKKGSNIIRVYGTPYFVIDMKTKLVYLRYKFSDDITKKIENGELIMKADTPVIMDEEIQNKLKDRKKKKLKNLTRVWRKSN
jgi:predicted house-cleaning NTP pyrophosphatase (Maf/HAM1 superfamily)